MSATWPSTPDQPASAPLPRPGGSQAARRDRIRRAAAAMLAVGFAVLMPAALTSAWIRGTVLSTSGYVAAVAPVAENPAVRAAVQEAVASEVDVIMNRAGALPGPLSSVPGGLAGDAVSTFMASPVFQQLWVTVNRITHSQLISVLNGDSTLVVATGGEVVLNLLPLINGALRSISGRLSALTRGAITLPPITALPAAACQTLGRLSRRQPTPACGQIPLFPASALAGPRLVFRALDTGTLVLLFLPPLAFAGALWATPRHRRTLLQMAIGGTLTLSATAIGMSVALSALTARATPRYQAVASVITHALTNSFFTLTTWCVAGGGALATIILLSAPTARLVTMARGMTMARTLGVTADEQDGPGDRRVGGPASPPAD